MLDIKLWCRILILQAYRKSKVPLDALIIIDTFVTLFSLHIPRTLEVAADFPDFIINISNVDGGTRLPA